MAFRKTKFGMKLISSLLLAVFVAKYVRGAGGPGGAPPPPPPGLGALNVATRWGVTSFAHIQGNLRQAMVTANSVLEDVDYRDLAVLFSLDYDAFDPDTNDFIFPASQGTANVDLGSMLGTVKGLLMPPSPSDIGHLSYKDMRDLSKRTKACRFFIPSPGAGIPGEAADTRKALGLYLLRALTYLDTAADANTFPGRPLLPAFMLEMCDVTDLVACAQEALVGYAPQSLNQVNANPRIPRDPSNAGQAMASELTMRMFTKQQLEDHGLVALRILATAFDYSDGAADSPELLQAMVAEVAGPLPQSILRFLRYFAAINAWTLVDPLMTLLAGTVNNKTLFDAYQVLQKECKLGLNPANPPANFIDFEARQVAGDYRRLPRLLRLADPEIARVIVQERANNSDDLVKRTIPDLCVAYALAAAALPNDVDMQQLARDLNVHQLCDFRMTNPGDLSKVLNFLRANVPVAEQLQHMDNKLRAYTTAATP